jgi:hypothetical protein
MARNSEVLALKYRPRRFEELIGQESISQTLALALDSKRLSHAYFSQAYADRVKLQPHGFLPNRSFVKTVQHLAPVMFVLIVLWQTKGVTSILSRWMPHRVVKSTISAT